MKEIECGDGILAELARGDWGQLTLRTVRPGRTAGGHYHLNTSELWWVVAGDAVMTLAQGGTVVEWRPGRGDLIEVPAGTWHSIRNMGEIDVVLVYWSDKVYEEQEKAT